MTLKKNAAQVAVQAEPCQKFVPLVTTPVGKSWEGDTLSNREARRLVNEVRSWAGQFNAPDALALVSAMDDMERLLIRAWAEISEAVLCLDLANSPHRTPEKAAEMRANAVSYLMRWNQGLLTMSTTTATKEQWAPCLLLEGPPTACGISTSYAERLPGLYDTPAQAMAAAEAAIHQRPDAIGCSAKRVEVPA